MTRIILSFIIGIVISQNTFCQDSIDVSKYRPESFSIDFNGTIFLISENTLYKLDKSYNKETEFSNKMYGKISSVDVSNPFKLLLFYKETGMLVFLDNHLKEIQSPISLPKQGLVNTELACSGSDNSFWIYYNDTHQIIKFDYKINAIASTPDLTILSNIELPPKSISEKGDKLFLEIPNFGILIFYNSGNYLQTLHFPKISSFSPISEKDFFYVDSINGPTVMDFTLNKIQNLSISNNYNTNNQMIYFNNSIYEKDKFQIRIHNLGTKKREKE